MSIRYFTYSMFHNKRPIVGSDFIRVRQLLKYWPETALYKYGENPDVLIFQKVYCSADYKFPAHFEKIKILDICDPDWLEGVSIKETIDAMDAITVPTQPLADFLKQLTDKPIVVVPDRFDLELVPKKPKSHTKEATTVGWFGYKHNAELLRPALPLIAELGLDLRIIANDDPYLWQYNDQLSQDKYQYVRYDESKIYDELLKCDFIIFPPGGRIVDKFKSNNKTVKAIMAGIPVATNKEEVLEMMQPENRRKYLDENYATIRSEYDVRKSVEQMKQLIATISQSKELARNE
jgi:hypothetical protein